MPIIENYMALWSITLFGKLSIHCEDTTLQGIESRKVQELFCYLLLFQDRTHSREKLASLFWGEYSTALAKKYLRQTLWELQSVFGSTNIDTPLFLVDSGWIGISQGEHLWLDVAVFERAAQLAHGIPGAKISQQNYQLLREFVKLYRGDLLEGCYEDWCILERERLQNVYLDLLDKLIDYCLANHEYEDGLVYGTQILHYDRARERTHRRLMRLYYLGGNRTEALRQYNRCAVALKEELSVPPSERTMALVEQIRKDNITIYPPVDHHESHSPDAHVLANILAHLNQLAEALLDLQRQVQENAHAVQQMLKNHQ